MQKTERTARRGKEEGQETDEEEEGGGEDLEPWHGWVRRDTHTAVEEMRKAQVEDWGDAVRRKVWILAGHIPRRHDGRWSTTMLDWQPAGGGRRAGHPKKRWRDDIEAVSAKLLDTTAQGEWRIAAENREEWLRMEEEWMMEMSAGEGYVPRSCEDRTRTAAEAEEAAGG